MEIYKSLANNMIEGVEHMVHEKNFARKIKIDSSYSCLLSKNKVFRPILFKYRDISS